MSVPKFNELFSPILAYMPVGQAIKTRDLVDPVVEAFQLTEEDKNELIPNSMRSRLWDRISWSVTYLRQAGLVKSVGRGEIEITPRGSELLRSKPGAITLNDFNQYQEFRDFVQRSRPDSAAGTGTAAPVPTTIDQPNTTPEEIIAAAFAELNQSLAQKLLDQIKSMTPQFFEQLIVDVMMKLGYGGTAGSGKAIGRSGDGGVDGVINQDKLGLEKIYLQAKRFTDITVGRKELQSFVGALEGKSAEKGVFITTSNFSRDARNYAADLRNYRLSLIDGQELAAMMIENNIGISLGKEYVIKQVDTDYFSEE